MITCVSFCRVSSCVSIHFAVHFLRATTKRFVGVGRRDVLSRLGMASATCMSLAPHTVLPYAGGESCLAQKLARSTKRGGKQALRELEPEQ